MLLFRGKPRVDKVAHLPGVFTPVPRICYSDFFEGPSGQRNLFLMANDPHGILFEVLVCEGGRLDGHVVCSDGLNVSAARPEAQCEGGTRSGKPCAELGCVPEGRASVANQVVEYDRDKEIMTGVKQRCGP